MNFFSARIAVRDELEQIVFTAVDEGPLTGEVADDVRGIGRMEVSDREVAAWFNPAQQLLRQKLG